MRVNGTEAAARVIDLARSERHGELTITIGTGCCESTAPFLFEDFWPGPDQEQVGEVAGVPVFAPEYLRRNYAGAEGVTIDVVEDVDVESMSIETELSCRLILRDRDGNRGIDAGSSAVCSTPGPADRGRTTPDNSSSGTPSVAKAATVATGGPSRVVGELPESLRRLRIRG